MPRKTRTETPKADTKKNVKSERQSGSKKPDKRLPPPKKSKRGAPSGPSSGSSSSSSSSSDSSSSDSEDSLDEDLSTGIDASDATKVGGTLLTLRPCVSSSTLEKFDEKASMGDRRSWWERFVNMSVQGGWTNKMKISELKMKMSSAVRNWRGQLSKHVQNDWRRLSGEFKRKYLKARTSESERYYTMRQKSNESAMEFFYRLNEAAVKAGIRYKKGKKDSAHHIKRFIKNLRDQQLKANLRNTRFHNLNDLEYVLQQDEDLGLDGEDSREVASVHGAVNDIRVQILLDTGASGSMVSLNLARRLKLKLQMLPEPIKVSALGGVPTYIAASARVKITLGVRVVYVMSVWVTNIGEDVEVLLGMNFMYAAGVRLCVREGLVQLPDEETILMSGGASRQHIGLDLPVLSTRSLYLRPGEHATVRIEYGQSNPQRDVVWAGRGDRWVTQVIYTAQSWATSVKVVNISEQMVWIDTRTPLARIVEFGSFPHSGRFVRPGCQKYKEWQQLIYESTPSPEMRKRERELDELRQEQEPPAVSTPQYEWPSKIMLRPRPGATAARIVQLQDSTKQVRPTNVEPPIKVVCNVATQTTEVVDVGTQTDAAQETPEVVVLKTSVPESIEANSSEAELDTEPSCSDAEVQESQDQGTEEMDLPSCVWPSTPIRKLEEEYARCMRVSQEDLDLEPAIYLQEGSKLLSQLRNELAMLPELKDLSPECDISKADVGDPDRTTAAEEKKLRSILTYHRKILLGDGNAAPAPARDVVCDLDVGDAKPVAQRPRSIAPHIMLKAYELLKKLLETELIEFSVSAWASPIVIVLKKNGVDIRMCIDYRVVNGFIQLSTYPLPLIDDLLIGFESAMWFMSLDMAIINNCLWGFVRLPAEEEKLVDQDVLEFLGLDPSERDESEREKAERRVPILTDKITAFKRDIPAPSQMGPVIGRSSYIDDIGHGAPTWDQLCEDLNALLLRLRYWNISVSLPKSDFGKLSIPYLSHEISADGLRATPKIAKGVQDLPFPKTLKGVQSFLGSLNYYHKFIEDFPVVAAVLYELTDEQVRAGRDLSKAKEAFEILKRKIVSTPLLRHPDRTRPFVIIPHANQWAACAVLGQEYDGVIHPARFTGRVLNDAELRYHVAEKEVVAVMRVLDVFQTLVQNCLVKVFTRHSVLSWLLKSKTADGRCVRWGVILSHWNLEVNKIQRDEDGLPAILGAGITPRKHLDEIAESLIPAKGRVKAPPVISMEMLEADFAGYVLSFDGAAKTSTRQGSCGCIIWELPGWNILAAHGFILEDVTVNDAEYYGLLKGLTLASEREIQDLVVVGDSRIVIQQVQGLINCNQPNLQRRLFEVEILNERFTSMRLVHVKREYNQAADYLTSKTLSLGASWQTEDPEQLKHLVQVSKIHEKLMKPLVIMDEDTQDVSPQEDLPVETPNGIRPGPESARGRPWIGRSPLATCTVHTLLHKGFHVSIHVGPVEFGPQLLVRPGYPLVYTLKIFMSIMKEIRAE
ncbi:hypothetical protein PR001_g1455 [Phytophthora rubi]|uniref:RNA-directed DNA polymerase n=1 Tax=Phytophthora rubi TaxID=129364 RepID=A0A6A3P360_9STRA|nr:hypothetical protein PR001_g1455 [Phytophthora rubi]